METDCCVRGLEFFLTQVPESEAMYEPTAQCIQEATEEADGNG